MPAALIIEIIQTIVALAPQIPEIISLGDSAIGMIRTGVVTPEQEADIRAQLDAMKIQIDASSP